MTKLDQLEQKLKRECSAREQAEALLKDKMREVFVVNQELRSLASALKKQGELTTAIIANAAEGIITFDSNGKVETMNPAAEQIFGYQASEVIGKKIDLLIGDHLPQGVKSQKYNQLQQTQKVTDSGERLVEKNTGEVFPVMWTVSKVSLDDRNINVVIVRDMTQRKMLEIQLAHAQKMESVGQLAAGIAHEINTPIQYVGDNINFLKDAFGELFGLLDRYQQFQTSDFHDTDTIVQELQNLSEAMKSADLDYLREEVPCAIDQAVEGTQRVTKIVCAMKEFSHPGTEEKSPTDINKAIVSAITVSKNEWKYVANLVTDFDEDLPFVPCLAGEFNQALLNLIVNAAHAMTGDNDEPEKQGTLTISTQCLDQWVEIRISDTGSGIPKEIQTKIFDPFFTTKPVGVGTGQGLAITYSAITEKHQGTIEYETTEGVGTTFIIRLPLTESNISTPIDDSEQVENTLALDHN